MVVRGWGGLRPDLGGLTCALDRGFNVPAQRFQPSPSEQAPWVMNVVVRKRYRDAGLRYPRVTLYSRQYS